MQFLQILLNATDTTAAATPTGLDSSAFLMPALLVGFFILMYVFTIRPQRKRDKELKAQVSKMAVGDSVVTIGGLVGTVANIQDDNVTITTSVAHTMVVFKKSAISTIIPRQ
jgi:preprotein translocase subunit YajC